MTKQVNATQSFNALTAAYVKADAAADKALATRAAKATQIWEAVDAMGGSLDHLKAPTGEARSNNTHMALYNMLHEGVGNALVGPKIMQDVIYNKAISGEGAVKLTGNVMTGTRTKKYIQQQIGKKISLIRKDIAAMLAANEAGDTEGNGAGARNTDLDRVLNALAKVVTQIRKAKGDDSIDPETREALKDVNANAMWKAICNA